MFVEIADGEFIAVDTIAKIALYQVAQKYPSGDANTNAPMVPHWLIETKKGEKHRISSATGPYYFTIASMLGRLNVQELVNART